VLDAGHFLWEGVPEQYAAAVLNAMRTTPEVRQYR
jgi:hypothetical protein